MSEEELRGVRHAELPHRGGGVAATEYELPHRGEGVAATLRTTTTLLLRLERVNGRR